MALAAFVQTMVCTGFASFVVRIVAPPTKHDNDSEICRFSQSTRHDSRTDCRHKAFVFDRIFDRRSPASNGTAK